MTTFLYEEEWNRSRSFSIFLLSLSDNSKVTHDKHLNKFKGRVMVYNEDFKNENFRWSEASAEPVFYIGTEQTQLSLELEAKKKELIKLNENHNSLIQSHNEKEKSLKTFETDTAREIAQAIAAERSYTSRDLKKNYAEQNYSPDKILDERFVSQWTETIKQSSPRSRLSCLDTNSLDLTKHLKKVENLLNTSTGSATVDFLKGHELMSIWIKQGYDYHTEKNLTDCLFCGSPLLEERLELILNNVIDDRFQKLELDIKNLTESNESLKKCRSNLINNFPSKNDFAPQLAESSIEKISTVRELLNCGEAYFTSITKALNQKSSSPNKTDNEHDLPTIDEVNSWQEKLSQAIISYNDLISQHNKIHDEFDHQQQLAKDALVNHHLAKKQEQYKVILESYKSAEENLESEKNALEKIQKQILELETAIRQHGPAADKITNLINCFLGHNEITVEVDHDLGYRLKRCGKPALGISSEGEKTAITLCYFLTLLEAEGRSIADLIIVLDDPISSLDTKSLNYAFNMLRSKLEGAGQLFFLTHNLHFMNEVKKWIKNRKEYRDKDTLKEPPLLFIDSKIPSGETERRSSIIKMPKQIREYESEYHYLFSLILKTSKQSPHECEYMYLIPNAMRKVLEVFLSFKVPGGGGLKNQMNSKIIQECSTDIDRLVALTRLSEVESHGDNVDDLMSFSSMTMEETHDHCLVLLDMINKLDSDHYKSMCKLCN